MDNYRQDTKNIWFPDQLEPVYDPLDPISNYQFKEYWKRERDRCINGFHLADGKVFISGWLYFHTVYWKIVRYVTNPKTKRKSRQITPPLLRDIDWDIFKDFEQCEDFGKFYALVGSRDFGKSVIAASRGGWLYTFFDNSESVFSGGEDKFIKLVTDKIEDGLTNLHPIFQKQRISSDWKKEVKAGWKDKKTNQPHPKSSNSRILMRNYDGGTKTMAANGTRPQFHLIDEIGTIPNLIGCIKDSDGCWWSGGGSEIEEGGVDPDDVNVVDQNLETSEHEEGDKPSCIAMFTGTGGDMEVGAEAGEIFFDPIPYNILDFENPEEPGKRMGRFISALRAKMKYKERSTLAKYLGINHPDLEKVSILVSNEEKALKDWWEPTYAKARKSGNQKTITKFLAYWPTKPSHSFLVISKNDFNVEAAAAQKKKLSVLERTGIPVELYHDGERIVHKFTDKVPITQFPLKDQDPVGCVVLYEPPITDAPFGLYVAGVDPYKQDTSKYSDSLGAIYIYKRMHSIFGEQYQDMLVAQYVGRPDSINVWNETVRNLIKYYNAWTLSENEDYGFIQYMINKGDSMYLMEQPDWLKDITPNSSIKRQYGIPATPKIIAHLNGLYKMYTEEVISKEIAENGSVIKEILGFSKILDPMLLEETIKFNSDGNFDRIRAASIAIAVAKHLDAQKISVSSIDTDPRLVAYFQKNKKSNGADKMFGAKSYQPPRKTSRVKRLFS